MCRTHSLVLFKWEVAKYGREADLPRNCLNHTCVRISRFTLPHVRLPIAQSRCSRTKRAIRLRWWSWISNPFRPWIVSKR
jgi:hypothetical protein